jgi:RNA polymerase sigma-70 factor (ECF subfamily)
MDDDLTAIRQLKAGKIDGLETLVCRYQVKAARAAFLVLRDEQAAEDVVQETFLKAFRHIQRFDISRPFGPYLLRSVVNAALDTARRDAKSISLDGDLAEIESLVTSGETPETQAEANQHSQQILAALDRLSPRQRAVIVQRYYLEMSEKEMSESLNAAPGTVKWLLNAARARLRDILNPERNSQ